MKTSSSNIQNCPTDLIQTRKELDNLTIAIKNQQQWMEKRQLLENTIQQLLEAIAKEKVFSFPNKIQEKQNLLLQLKQELQRIDEWIDQVEDLTEQNLEEKKMQFFLDLWVFNPEKQKLQEATWQKKTNLIFLEEQFRIIEKKFESFYEHLENIVQIRQKIKRKGIFCYIFGISPNLLISQRMKEISNLIQATLPPLNQVSVSFQNNFIQTKLQKISQFLENLNTACQTTWSFRQLDTFFF